MNRKIFQMLGINLRQSNLNHLQFNAQNMQHLLLFILGTIASICYPIFEANRFEEYIASFYIVSSMIICLTVYASIIWRIQKFVEFFTSLEITIQAREFTFQRTKSNRNYIFVPNFNSTHKSRTKLLRIENKLRENQWTS